MRFDATHARVQLPADQLLRLTDAQGTRLRGIEGTSWITIDNDPRDLVLEPGEEWVVDARQPVLVTPLKGGSTIGVCAPAQPHRSQRHLHWPWAGEGNTRALAGA